MPAGATHSSFVQALPSEQDLNDPDLQVVPSQLSPTVQALLSEHGALEPALYAHPDLASHKSVVHTLPSSQNNALGVATHFPVCWSQVSTVQVTPSAQSTAWPEHAP